MPKMTEDDYDESELFGSPPPAAAVNPLSAYFRMPGLSIELPTKGRFLPRGSIEFDFQEKLHVFPMRGEDELLMKTPEALMSGLAVEKLIESCVPGIKNPSLISAPDIDVILLAIRAATYGNIMSLEVVCPECFEELSFDCDLTMVLATLTPIPDDLDVRLSEDVVVVMRPHSLDSQTKLLLAAYEVQRTAQNIPDEMAQELRKIMFNDTFSKLSDFQTQSLSDAIVKVVIPDAVITDRQYIFDFVKNITKDWNTKIQNRVGEINSMGIDRNLPAQCSKCSHEWTTKLEFNPATFFA